MRRIILLVTLLDAVALMPAATAAAAAAPQAPSAPPRTAGVHCAYAQWGPYSPTRTVAGQVFTDGSVWIALRRNTSCGYYFVTASRYGSGKSFCGWQTFTASGAPIGAGGCAPAPGRADSPTYAGGVFGALTTRYPDGRVYYVRTRTAP